MPDFQRLRWHSAPLRKRGNGDVRLTGIIPALGFAQIISWGSLYYSIAVLASPMQHALGISQTLLFGAFTVGLLVSGAASPAVGRMVDERGGRRVLAAGSLLSALAFLILCLARNPAQFVLGWIVAGLAMAACLYDPAFATLHQLSGDKYRRAVTALTLFGGFASTVFWPLTHWLEGAIGWRATLGAYAVLHLAVCLPIHWLFLPDAARRVAPDRRVDPPAEEKIAAPTACYYWIAAAFSIAMFIVAVLSAYLIEVLKGGGMSAGNAIVVASVVGPMQVAARIVEFGFARRVRATTVGTAAFALLASSMLILAMAGQSLVPALLFAALYGAANGVMTIVRGTAPAELFGHESLGQLLGRLARPAFIAKAMAPVAFAAVLARGLTVAQGVIGLAILAALGLASFLIAVRIGRTKAGSGRAQ
ncbi:MAG TPA: MFS transporter [Burkholderiales bacterium]|nr:MFS transporter [Burkholderiales bacterium]